MANPKLLLIHDVEDLGRSGDIVSVKPGYARNYLFPQELAIIATPNALKMQAKLKKEREEKAIQDKKEAEAVASQMTDMSVTTTVKVDHDGHMYGSVSAADIVDLIQAQHGITLEKKNIQMKHAFKEVGDHEVAIKLKEGVTSKVMVKIVAEDTHSHNKV